MKKIILAGIAALSTLSIMAEEAKYIFYFIGDGMGMGHVNAAEIYNRDVLKNDSPILMLTFPVAYQFYLRHPDETLIVITADHDTGGMAYGRNGMNGTSIGYADYQKISKDAFGEWTYNWGSQTQNPSWEEMEKALREKLGFWNGVPVSDNETEKLKELFRKTFIDRNAEDQKTLYQTFNAFTAKVFDVLNAHMGIGWTTTSHTGNFVPVYAVGANSHYFTGNLNNIEIPLLIKRAAGLK